MLFSVKKHVMGVYSLLFLRMIHPDLGADGFGRVKVQFWLEIVSGLLELGAKRVDWLLT